MLTSSKLDERVGYFPQTLQADQNFIADNLQAPVIRRPNPQMTGKGIIFLQAVLNILLPPRRSGFSATPIFHPGNPRERWIEILLFLVTIMALGAIQTGIPARSVKCGESRATAIIPAPPPREPLRRSLGSCHRLEGVNSIYRSHPPQTDSLERGRFRIRQNIGRAPSRQQINSNTKAAEK